MIDFMIKLVGNALLTRPTYLNVLEMNYDIRPRFKIRHFRTLPTIFSRTSRSISERPKRYHPLQAKNHILAQDITASFDIPPKLYPQWTVMPLPRVASLPNTPDYRG